MNEDKEVTVTVTPEDMDFRDRAKAAGLPDILISMYGTALRKLIADERAECVKSASMLAHALVLAERENCAQLIETYEKAGNMVGAPHFVMVLKDCAAAIRARGQV
jgi:hypothetical protein